MVRPPRILVALFVMLVFSAATFVLPAAAAPKPSPSASASGAAADDAAPAKNAGSIDGRISSIDYQRGVMTLDVSGGRRTVDVLIVPGTSITGSRDFHTIADLKRGAHVQVLLSQHGATFTAQIIRLL